MSVSYENIATDCGIIAQKIEALRKALLDDTGEKGQRIEFELWRAQNAIEAAKADAL